MFMNPSCHLNKIARTGDVTNIFFFRNLLPCFVCNKPNASFRFPSDRSARLRWINVLGLETNVFPDDGDRLCDSHFDPSDYEVTQTGKRRLKSGVLPKYFIETKASFLPISVRINTSEEGFYRALMMAVGILLICFWSCLLLWLSTRKVTKDLPKPVTNSLITRGNNSGEMSSYIIGNSFYICITVWM